MIIWINNLQEIYVWSRDSFPVVVKIFFCIILSILQTHYSIIFSPHLHGIIGIQIINGGNKTFQCVLRPWGKDVISSIIYVLLLPLVQVGAFSGRDYFSFLFYCLFIYLFWQGRKTGLNSVSKHPLKIKVFPEEARGDKNPHLPQQVDKPFLDSSFFLRLLY